MKEEKVVKTSNKKTTKKAPAKKTTEKVKEVVKKAKAVKEVKETKKAVKKAPVKKTVEAKPKTVKPKEVVKAVEAEKKVVAKKEKTNAEKSESVKVVKKVTKKTPVKKTTEAKPKTVKPKEEAKPVKVAKTKVEKEELIKNEVKKEKTVVKKKPAPKKKAPVKKEKVAEPEKITKVPEVIEEVFEENKVVNAKVDPELIKARINRQTIETIILTVLFFIILLLLLNKTFVRTGYSNQNISIDIPRFMYYVSDKDNTVTFKTLRKSENVREFFDEYLEGFVYYDCSETGYYDEQTNIFIKSITVDKKFAVKTVKIEYSTKSLNEICS